MSNLIQFLRTLVSERDSAEQLDEKYLSQAVDVADLEHRIEELEHRSANEGLFQTQAPAHGYASRGGATW